MLNFATVVKNLILILSLAASLAANFSARAQDIINPNNTVVRIAFTTGGTNFGYVDLELFDQEKPETVRNFLLYVYGGGYSNLVFQRLVPNFVLQGGYVTVPNRASVSQFTSYVTGPNFGPITNEYSFGPELSNLFGTVAMAKVGGQTNSADSQFFFNLNNNTNLDTIDGGFTVFGHVVNTTAPNNGTNLLGYFNSLTNGTQIRSVGVGSPQDFFGNLPVSGISGTVRYYDLFVADSFILANGRERETNAPSVALNDSTDLVTTNGSLQVVGTASDDTAVGRILIETPFGRATGRGATNWAVDLQLIPGTNDFNVYSIDMFGNRSAPQRRKVFYLVYTPLHLSVEGPGRTSGLTNGQILMAGVIYHLTATPKAGKYFLGWRGDIFASARSIKFRMSENLSAVARFSDTLKGQARGTYNGIFFPATNGPKSSLGWLTLNLAASGSYFGRLAPLGASYQTRGSFAPLGESIITGQLGLDRLTLGMGYVGEGTEAIIANYSNGHFSSEGVLFRVQKYSGTNVPASKGRYTYLLYPTADTNILSGDGYGYGTMVVSSRGRITMSGHLGDGVPIKQITSILKGERWPLFAQASLGRGAVMGFGLFTSNHVINSTARWYSPDFPGRTNQVVRFAVSPYTSPSLARLFNWTNGVIQLAGDGLAAPLSANLVLNEDGSFTIPSNPNNISLDVADETGLLTGSFTHPVSLALTPLKGAVLQSSNIAAGYFGSGTHNGSVLIRAQ
jgi:cyclophilin family peptidyl-prolyl cis-trans isomerase